MKEIRWTAGNGKEVRLANITERTNMADHTVINKVDEIEIELDGKGLIYQEMIDFENGKAIKTMGITIRVPKEVEKDVVEMIEAYKARYNARIAARAAANQKYENHYNIIKEAMEE